MTRYLLDTDCLIDHLKGVRSTIAFLHELSQRGEIFCTSAVVLAELYAGLHSGDQARAEQFLTTLEYLPTSADAARQAGAWRYAYAGRGQRLSLTDCLIAATTAQHQARLVTGNVKDFPMPEANLLPLPRARGGDLR
jgi:tRNA(fMet)-specific endonuclease VapC